LTKESLLFTTCATSKRQMVKIVGYNALPSLNTHQRKSASKQNIETDSNQKSKDFSYLVPVFFIGYETLEWD